MTHTEGPWKWKQIMELSNDQRLIGLQLESPSQTHDPVILSVRHDWVGYLDSSQKGQANAHLIAAAPDLLEACKALCAWHDHPALTGLPDGTPVPNDVPSFDETVTMVLNAIAKAEGRTP